MLKYLKGAFSNLAPIKFTEVYSDPQITEQLVKYEKQEVWTKYKFGVLYVQEGQTEENSIFGNGNYSPCQVLTLLVEGSSDYEDFLKIIGDKITLEGWSKFRGGLDVKSNTMEIII
jgi:hypothetical protein